METRDKTIRDKNGFTKGFTKEIANCFMWLEHITVVDLSNKNLLKIGDNVKFPTNLVELKLSHNKLTTIPTVVHNLDSLKHLDISHNKLEYCDDTPKFCHSVETLNLSHNSLLGPPYWIWTEFPAKLLKLDLSFNTKITSAFQDGYFEELLEYATPVVHLKINNCNIKHHLKLVSTFTKAKTLDLGSDTLTYMSVNKIIDLPSEGLENCCDIQSLNLSNTHVYNIKKNIDVFRNLVEINLSQNYIAGLPPEFCNLLNLETCILSNNSLMYLPDDLGKLKKLTKLYIDSNELCLLPDSIVDLTNLHYLDIYNNCLYEFPDEIKWVEAIDFALNYFEEPEDTEYLEKKVKLRFNLSGRLDGRKLESVRPDSEHTPDVTDDEEYLHSISSNTNLGATNYDTPSSPEDWDSDDYWVPRFGGCSTLSAHSNWLHFVKKKMAEGSFCPMDAHTVSIAEKVRYEKICMPKIEHESDGQFDDFSDDDS